jgi:transposase
LEQATHRNVALRWLLKKRRPDHKTSADVRQHTLQPLRQVCRTCTLLGKQLDLFGAALVALEGSKVRAGNAKERHFTPTKLTQLLAQIDARVDAYLKELARSDAPAVRRTSR